MVTIEEAQGDPILFEQFLEENLRFVHFMLKKLSISNEYDDSFQIGSLALVKAIKTYKPSKGIKFTSYAATVIRNQIFMDFRKKKNRINVISLDEPIAMDEHGTETTIMDVTDSGFNVETTVIDKIGDSDKINALIESLTERQLKILSLMNQEVLQKDIAIKIGLTQSYISRLIQEIKQIYTDIDNRYQKGSVLNIKGPTRITRRETMETTEKRLTKSYAESVIAEGKTTEDIVNEFREQFGGQTKTIRAMLAKWGIIEKKEKSQRKEITEENPDGINLNDDQPDTRRIKKQSKKLVPVDDPVLMPEVMVGKSHRYELREELYITNLSEPEGLSLHSAQLSTCKYENIPRMIRELQQIYNLHMEAANG